MLIIRLLVTMFCYCLLAACQSTPAVNFYVLEAMRSAPLSTPEISKKLSIGIGPVSVPTLLDRKKIVTRLANNGVQIAEFQQWATPLQDNLTETLAHNLTLLQPSFIIRTYPWSVHGHADLQVIIDFVRFDTTRGKSTNLEANWSIKNEKNQMILQNGRTLLDNTLTDSSYPGTVHGLSTILAKFSQELSLAIANVVVTERPQQENKN